jgi:hypothetical protein
MKPSLVVLSALMALICRPMAMPGAIAGESFQQLKGSYIARTFIGMELTDEVLWAYDLAKGGTLSSVAMGKRGSGRWRVQKDELCLQHSGEDERCYDVWVSGASVQLRQPGFDLSEDGILQKPGKRNLPQGRLLVF